MKKRCSKCEDEKELDEFNKKKSNKDGLQGECRECQGETSREYYKVNNEKQKKQINEAKKKRIKENKEKYFNLLCESKCVDCPESNPVVLEYDHRDGVDKINGVGRLVASGYSWDVILKEIEKCDIRCANCHRIRTAKQFGWYKGLLQEI